MKLNYKLLPYPLLRVLLAFLALFILYRSATAVIAEYYYDKAIESESDESYSKGVSYAKKAVIMMEGVSSYHEFLGRNYLRYALFAEDSLTRVNAALESEREYLLAIEKSPMIALYYLGLAGLYQNKSELFYSVEVKVSDLYEKAIYAYPANNILRFKFAEILMRVGRYDKAARSLEHTLGRGRRVKDAPALLAEAYRLNGDAVKARATIDKKLTENPLDGFANFVKGNVLVDLGKLDEAVTYYVKALEKSEGDNQIDVLRQLAVTYLNSGDADRAAEYLNQILRERPQEKFSSDLMRSIRSNQTGGD